MLKKSTIVLFTVILLPSVLFFAACKKEEKKPSLPVLPSSVEVLLPDNKPIYTIAEIGTIKPMREIELISKSAGTVDKLNTKLGDLVLANQQLAVIDSDVANSPARINLDNARKQLLNATKGLSDIQGNNEDMVYQSELRVQSLQTNIDKLKRNLSELQQANKSTLKTMQSQLQTAQTNLDNATLADDNTTDQFIQSYDDYYENVENSLNRFFATSDSFYENATDVINPNHQKDVYLVHLYRLFGVRDQKQKNKTVNLYNQVSESLESVRDIYNENRPLNFDNTDSVLSEAQILANDIRLLAEAMRIMLDNSMTDSRLTASMLASYKATISGTEPVLIQNVDMISGLKQGYASLALNETMQVGMAGNNLVIAENHLRDAETSLSQFKLTSSASIKDVETQINQFTRDLASAKSSLASAKRTRDLQNDAKKLEVNMLNNQVRLAEKSVGDYSVISTINGAVSELNIDQGDYVSPGTLIGRVADYKQVKIVFYVNKDIASYLSVNHPITFHTSDATEKVFGGVVSRIAPLADPISKKMRIEAFTSNHDLYLKPEMFVNLTINITQSVFDSANVYLPLNAVMIDQNEQYVFVVEDGNKEKGIVLKRLVEIGKIYDQWATVKNGLTKNDVVIIEGQRNLEEGDIVEISNDQ